MNARRYFPDQLLRPEAELAPEDLAGRFAYVAAVYEEERLRRLEIVHEGRIAQVVYPEDERTPEEVFAEHRSRYPEASMLLRRRGAPEAGRTVTEERHYSAAGELLETTQTEEHDGEVALVEHRDAAGRLTRKDVHEEAGGGRHKIRMLDGDGNLLGEEEDE